MIALALTIVTIAIVSLLLYSKKKHEYWSSRGIYTPGGCLPIYGHGFGLFHKKYRWEYLDKIYTENKEKKLWGMYMTVSPCLIVSDPDLIKLILVKDADYFVNRMSIGFDKEKDRMFLEFLTVLKGDKWKALRALMTPTFSSGKIRGTFPLVEEKVNNLLKLCDQEMKENGFVEMYTALKRFALDVIGTCAFGIELDSLSDEEGQIIKAASGIMNPTFVDVIKITISFLSSVLFKKTPFAIEGKHMRCLENGIRESIEMREKSGIRRGDFLDLMVDSLKEYEARTEITDKDYPMSMNTILSQSILFLLAGFDTTANGMVFMLYLLAENTHCQDELRLELQKIKETDGEINYRNLMEAKYFDACVSESLRMYSPAHFLERTCSKDFKLPDHDLTIPEQMSVQIPLYSLHYDPDFWKDPRTYNPDRFMPENKANIVPYTYMPFGHGPRNCIGMRFALMEMKLGIAHLVLNYKTSLKPGSEMNLGKYMAFSTIRPDGNGLKLILEPISQIEEHQ